MTLVFLYHSSLIFFIFFLCQWNTQRTWEDTSKLESWPRSPREPLLSASNVLLLQSHCWAEVCQCWGMSMLWIEFSSLCLHSKHFTQPYFCLLRHILNSSGCPWPQCVLEAEFFSDSFIYYVHSFLPASMYVCSPGGRLWFHVIITSFLPEAHETQLHIGKFKHTTKLWNEHLPFLW